MGGHVHGGIRLKAGGYEKGKTTEDSKGEKIYLGKAVGTLIRLV